MALSFPLSRAAFMDLLPVQRMTFDIPETLSQTRTRGGEILTADNGARLWQGEITLGQITRDELALVRPVLNLLRGAGSSFLAFAILAERQGLDSAAYPQKGFYYLGGLTEGTETLLCFAAMCLWPAAFPALALGFAALCGLTIGTRLLAGWTLLDAAPNKDPLP